MPNEKDRGEIFEVHLRNKPLVSGIRTQELSAKSEGFSGADIASVCYKAALGAIRRAVEEEKETSGKPTRVLIQMEDIETAFNEVLQELK